MGYLVARQVYRIHIPKELRTKQIIKRPKDRHSLEKSDKKKQVKEEKSDLKSWQDLAGIAGEFTVCFHYRKTSQSQTREMMPVEKRILKI